MNIPDPATLVSPEEGSASDASWPELPDAPPLAVGTLFGGYRIVRAVGGGGMGQVYEAFDAELARAVALKVMRPDRAAKPEARERFLREARALAAVSNPHVVAIHHVGQHDGQPFLVMELLTGETLDARLRAGPMAIVQLVQTAREIATGLAAAHRAGVIHRDIKPDNVIVTTPDGTAKLIDFGLAHTTRLGGDGRRTVGTPLYMSPEQVLGQPVTERSDLFSLGVLLYRMATGRVPFEGASLLEWRTRLLAPEPPQPVEQHNPAVPPPLADLIRRLLAKEPEGRPESARAVEWELGSLLQNLVSQSSVLTNTPRPLTHPSGTSSANGIPALPHTRHARPWVWAAVATVLVATLAVVLFALTRPRTEPTPLPPARGEPLALFNGRDLNGWHGVEGKMDQWAVREGVLVGTHKFRNPAGKDGDQFLLTDREFTDYELTFEFRWPVPGGHTTLLLRAKDEWPNVEEDWTRDKYRVTGLELNMGDEGEHLPPAQRKPANPLYASGGFYKLKGPNPAAPNKPIGEWNAVKVTSDRTRLTVEWNGVETFNADLDEFAGKVNDVRALGRSRGAIALRTHSGKPIEFRNLVLTPIGK